MQCWTDCGLIVNQGGGIRLVSSGLSVLMVLDTDGRVTRSMSAWTWLYLVLEAIPSDTARISCSVTAPPEKPQQRVMYMEYCFMRERQKR